MIAGLLAFGFNNWRVIAAGIAALAALSLFAYGAHKYNEHERAEGRAEVQAKFDAFKAEKEKERLAAVQRATDITNLWNATRERGDKLERERDAERNQRLAAATVAAKTLPPGVAAVVVPAPAVRVLNDAIDAGNTSHVAEPAGSVAKDAAPVAEGAASTVGLLTQWGVQCADLYDEARGMVEGWQRFYAGLQAAQK